MGRRDWNHFKTDLIGGINQEIDSTTPQECADARNVWAPNGFVERRPGYFTTSSTRLDLDLLNAKESTTNSGHRNVLDYTTGSTLDGQIDNIDENLDIYNVRIVASITEALKDDVIGIKFFNTTDPAADVQFLTQYYNGSDWISLPSRFLHIADGENVTTRYSRNIYDSLGTNFIESAFQFIPPDDWAETTIAAVSGGWIRFLVHGDISDGTQSTTATITAVGSAAPTSPGIGMASVVAPVQFRNTERVIYWGQHPLLDDGSALMITDYPDKLRGVPWRPFNIGWNNFEWHRAEPGTFAVIPQFNEVYLAYQNNVLYYNTSMGWTDTALDLFARVESDDLIVGAGGPFDRETIPLLGAWPQCKYTVFFQGKLWAAGMADEPYTVRWSASAPYYKVWPSDAFEYLMEDDNSPITGMAALGENLVVFKRDSIWQMVFTDVDTFGVARYTPVRVVSGIGCVSNSSIQQVRGNLVFLAEDGIYRFDGVQATKATEKNGYDRLRELMRTVAKTEFSVATRWKAKGVYLLAVQINNDTDFNSNPSNNHVIVWDYVHDAWWVWDGFEVANWMRTEGTNDEEEIWFVTNNGRINKLGGEHDYHQAISSYVTSQRINYESNVKHTVRQVEVTAQNDNNTMTVEVLGNDEPSGQSAALDFKDRIEPVFGTAQFEVDKFATRRLRARKMGFRKTCDHSQVKITSSGKNIPFILRNVDVSFVPLGRR